MRPPLIANAPSTNPGTSTHHLQQPCHAILRRPRSWIFTPKDPSNYEYQRLPAQLLISRSAMEIAPWLRSALTIFRLNQILSTCCMVACSFVPTCGNVTYLRHSLYEVYFPPSLAEQASPRQALKRASTTHRLHHRQCSWTMDIH